MTRFKGKPAIDPQTNTLVKDGSGQVYAVTDTSFASPLEVTDTAGLPLATISTGPLGIHQDFDTADQHLEVVWKSGPYTVTLESSEGIAAAAAASAAQPAADAAAITVRDELSSTFATQAQLSEVATGDPIAVTDQAVNTVLTNPASAASASLSATYAARDQQVGADHAALVEDYMRARGGTIGTGGLPAVALRFDHGLANFKNVILPLLQARQLPSGLAINTDPEKWTYAENAGTSWADVREWAYKYGVEVWNHSHTHADSLTDADILANIATDPLATFATEVPNFTVEGFAIPGGGADFHGWTPTNTPQHFGSRYAAGRAALRHHAAVTGHLGGSVWSLTGGLVNGRRHQGLDSTSATGVIDVIKRAQALQGGVQLMMHPSMLDNGGMSTAGLTEVLDYITAERDAGRLLVLTMSGLMGADVRHAYRHNIIRPFTDTTAWTGSALPSYTFTDGVVSSSTATATIRQNISFTDIEAVKGRVREFSVEARAVGGTATLRLWASASGTVGDPLSYLKNFTLPTDGVWRTYRIHPVMLKTAFSTNLDVGRAAGTGTLEMRNVKVAAV